MAAAGIGAIGSLISGILGNNQQKWSQGALINVLNELNQQNQVGLNAFQGAYNPALQASQNNINNLGGEIFGGGGQPGQISQLNWLLQNGFSQLPGLFQNQGIGNAVGNMSQLGASGGGTQLNDILQQMTGILQNQGQTQGGNAALTNLNKFGMADNGQQQLMQQIASALGTNPAGYGQTNTTKLMQDLAGQTVASQGKTDLSSQMGQLGGALVGTQGAIGQIPGLQDFAKQLMQNPGGVGNNSNLASFANSLMQNPNIGNIPNLTNKANSVLDLNALGTPGQTQAGAAGEQASLQGYLSGGKNAASNYLLARGENLSANNPVLPTSTVYNIARDQSARDNLNAAKTAREQAFARSGVTGPTVAAGSTNSDLAPFMDSALQNVAQAGQNALVGQQGLGLQQLGQGLGAVSGAQGLQNQLLSLYGGNLTNLENAATGRLGAGGQLGLGAQSEANNVLGIGANTGTSAQALLQSLMGLGANTGLGAQSMANNNLGLGAGQLDTANSQQMQNLFSALGIGAQGGQMQSANATQGANLLNQGTNTQIGANSAMNPFLQTQMQNLFGAGNQMQSTTGLQGSLNQNVINALLGQASGQQGAYQGLLGSQGNLLNSIFGGYGQGLSELGNLSGQGMSYMNNTMGGIANLFRGLYNPTNALGQGLGGFLTGLGGLIPGNLGGGGAPSGLGSLDTSIAP